VNHATIVNTVNIANQGSIANMPLGESRVAMMAVDRRANLSSIEASRNRLRVSVEVAHR